MEFPSEVDVVIVGAGIVGLGSAVEAARRGATVLVVDKERAPGGEASGRALGSIRIQGRASAEASLAHRARQLWQKEAGAEHLELSFQGNIYICDDETERSHLEALVTQSQAQGLEGVRLLSPAAARELIPAAAGDFSLAMYSPTDGQCHPLRATEHFGRKARRLGVIMSFETKALDLVEREGGITAVITSRGTVRTNAVVLACGIWTPHLAVRVGIRIPIMPIVLTLCETTPVPPLFNQTLRAFGFSARQRPNGKVVLGAGINARITHELSLYDLHDIPIWAPRLKTFRKDILLRPAASGLILRQIASLSTRSPRVVTAPATDPRADSREMGRALTAITQVFPQMRSAEIGRTWGGRIDMSPDGLPIVDDSAGPSGLVIVAGLCGHGLALAPALGETAADLALGEAPAHDIKQFSIRRFSQRPLPVPAKMI